MYPIGLVMIEDNFLTIQNSEKRQGGSQKLVLMKVLKRLFYGTKIPQNGGKG